MTTRTKIRSFNPGLVKCPTGIRGLDEITDGGLPQGRSTLVCGATGSGKTLLAIEFIMRGARQFNGPGVFMAFEESGKELATNVASLGFNLIEMIRRKKVVVDHVIVERSEIEETGEPVSNVRVPSGIARLDAMLGGKGYFKGSSVLVSGTAGMGKTSVAAAFANSICQDGGRCLYWSSEESPDPIIRNMASIGYDLGRHVRRGGLRFHSVRPILCGLESHLMALQKMVTEFEPTAVVMDSITNLSAVADNSEIKAMLTQVIDFLKSRGITAIFTSLTAGGSVVEQTEVGVSSLMDTWLLLSAVQSASERNRVLYLLKNRGIAHSNQMRDFILTIRSVELIDVYVGPGAVYTGAARISQEARDNIAALVAQSAADQRQRELAQEKRNVQAQVATLQARLANIAAEQRLTKSVERQRIKFAQTNLSQLSRVRHAD